MKAKLTDHSYKNPLYNTWKDMRKRCNNISRREYKWYGARGISVCKEWETFEGFLQDMLPSWFEGGTIERKDNSLGYNKNNCLWVTRTKQQANRSNVYGHWKHLQKIKEFRAQGYSQDAVAAKLGMSQATVSRILAGNCKQMGDCE